MRSVVTRPDFRRLWLGQLASEVGDWAARLAITFLVWQRSGSALSTSLVVVLSFLPALGAGQWLTVRVQRFPARSTLIALDLIRAAAFVLLVARPTVPVAMAVSLLVGLLTIPFGALRSAVMPEVTGPHLVVPGVKVIQSTQDAAVILGYLAGGLLVTATSARGALAFNALTYLASAALLARLQCPAARQPVAADKRVSLASGMQAISRRPAVAAAAGLSILALAAGVATEAIVVPLAAGFSDLAWLPTLIFAGTAGVSLLATLVIPSRFSGPALLWTSFALFVVPLVVMAGLFLTSGPLPLVGVLVSGLLFAAPVPANALAAMLLPLPVRAAAFSLVTGAIYVAQGVATAGAGALFDGAGRVGLTALVGVFLVSGLAVQGWYLAARRAVAPSDLRLVDAHTSSLEPAPDLAA